MMTDLDNALLHTEKLLAMNMPRENLAALRRVMEAARLVIDGTEIEWCETHGSVNVDGYCEAAHDDASSGRWPRDRFDDVIAERFGKCEILSVIVSAALTPQGDTNE